LLREFFHGLLIVLNHVVEALVVNSDRLHVTLHLCHLGFLLLNVVAQTIPLVLTFSQLLFKSLNLPKGLRIVALSAVELVF